MSNFKIKWWHIGLGLVGLMLVASLFDSPSNFDPQASAEPKAPEVPKPSKEQLYASEVAALYKRIKAGEIAVQSTETDEQITSFAYDLYVWQDAASYVSKQDGHPGQDTAKLVVAEFKKLFPSLYPALRKQYAKAIGQRLWRDNWEIEQRGTRITFIKSAFANNANIADAHGLVKKNLYYLRFKRAEYKWIKSESEYTYYDIESRPDTQVGP